LDKQAKVLNNKERLMMNLFVKERPIVDERGNMKKAVSLY
jgi:hypothetical protein